MINDQEVNITMANSVSMEKAVSNFYCICIYANKRTPIWNSSFFSHQSKSAFKERSVFLVSIFVLKRRSMGVGWGWGWWPYIYCLVPDLANSFFLSRAHFIFIYLFRSISLNALSSPSTPISQSRLISAGRYRVPISANCCRCIARPSKNHRSAVPVSALQTQRAPRPGRADTVLQLRRIRAGEKSPPTL